MFELFNLTYHAHPTVKLWAEKLLHGQLIVYHGDPLLDFGLANFLDRISYKNPKSAEKLAKLKKQRMSALEKPINAYDFTSTNQEDLPAREEEQYLYKYFKEKGPKVSKKAKDINEDDIEFDAEEDPELEKFA